MPPTKAKAKHSLSAYLWHLAKLMSLRNKRKGERKRDKEQQSQKFLEQAKREYKVQIHAQNKYTGKTLGNNIRTHSICLYIQRDRLLCRSQHRQCGFRRFQNTVNILFSGGRANFCRCVFIVSMMKYDILIHRFDTQFYLLKNVLVRQAVCERKCRKRSP